MTKEPTITLDEAVRTIPELHRELRALREEVVQLKSLLGKATSDPDRLRDVKGTAAYLSATDGAVRALIKRGDLKSVQIGTTTYVAQSAIHEWIEASHKAQESAVRRQELTKRRTNQEG